MDAGKTWVERVQVRTLRWLVKSPASNWLLAGTFAFAGLSAAAMNAPAGAFDRDHGTVGSSGLLAPDGHCYNDPDGDGTIKCDDTVSPSSLPASYGQCFIADYGDVHIICQGANR